MANKEQIVITVDTISNKPESKKYSVKGTNGEWYGEFKEWQGVSKPAYDAFLDLDLKKGDKVRIEFVDKLGSDKKIYHNIAMVYRATDETQVSNPVRQTPKANTYVPNEEKPNWDNIAVGKVQSLFLQAFIQSGKTFSEAKLQVTQARQLAELVVFGEQKSQVQNQEPLPTIQQEEPPLPDLPF